MLKENPFEFLSRENSARDPVKTLAVLKEAVREGHIEVVDELPELGLKVYSYTDCTDSAPEWMKRCRGIVVREEDGGVPDFIFWGLPYGQEYLTTPGDVADEGEKVYVAPEGVLLRVFYVPETSSTKGVWLVSTQRRLELKRSRWGSRVTFDIKFAHALRVLHTLGNLSTNSVEDWVKTLNPGYQYLLLLGNDRDNRVVCLEESVPLYHLATIDAKTGKLEFDTDIGLPKLEEVPHGTDLHALIEKMDPMEKTGLYVFDTEETVDNLSHHKLVIPEYKRLRDLRGNNGNILFRFVELFLLSQKTVCQNPADLTHLLNVGDYVKLYPEYEQIFIKYVQTFNQLPQEFLELYKQRYIRKEYIDSSDAFWVLKRCHSIFLEYKHQGQSHRIDLVDVKRVLLDMPPKLVYRILKTRSNTLIK